MNEYIFTKQTVFGCTPIVIIIEIIIVSCFLKQDCVLLKKQTLDLKTGITIFPVKEKMVRCSQSKERALEESGTVNC